MKIAVVRTGPLFAHDDICFYGDNLRAALAEQGHSVELLTYPFSTRIADVVPEAFAYRLFDLRYGYDFCICLGNFSHAIRHANKRVWVLTTYGPFAELWDTPYGAVTASHTNVATRQQLQAMDRVWLSEAQLVRAGSPTLAESLATERGVEAPILYPQAPLGLKPSPSNYGDYFLTAGALVDTARFPLLIDAVRIAGVRLVIMGFEYAREEREYIAGLIAGDENIQLELNPSYERFCQRAAAALGYLAAPFRAGTVDLFSLTAALFRRAIVTTSDSGELARFVDDGVDGYASATDTATLAETLRAFDRRAAKRFGRRLEQKTRTLLPSWRNIARELTQ